MTHSGQFNLEYWSAFGNFCKQDTAFLRNFKKERKPGKENWLGFGIGSKSANLVASIASSKNYASVYVNIPDNKPLFQSLFEHKNEIEEALQMKLD